MSNRFGQLYSEHTATGLVLSGARCALLLVALTAPWAMAHGEAADATLERQRGAFLEAERQLASAPWKRFSAITRDLRHYPLYPYLEQAALLRNLNSIPGNVLMDFFSRRPHLPVRFKLRRAWLRLLARRGRWHTFAAQYQSGDGTAFDCLEVQARFHLGQQTRAWQHLEALWLTGRSLPGECDAPLSWWRQAGRLSPELAWQRIVLAVRAGNPRLAGYLRRYVSAAHRKLLNLWLRGEKDARVIATLASAAGGQLQAREFLTAEAMIRLARRDLDGAMKLWSGNELRPTLSAASRGRVQQAIAIRLARRHRPQASRWLASRDIDNPSDRLHHWRLAVALWRQDWRQLSGIYSRLPERLRQQQKWRYWHARTLRVLADGNTDAGIDSLSRQRSYYGFRAADLLDRSYRLGHRSLERAAPLIDRISRRAEARRSRELLALGRLSDARREWRQLLADLSEAQRAAAALLARRWQWHSAVIATLAGASERDDLDLRFPLIYKNEINRAARLSGLSPARIYSVVRQESAFVAAARSAAGARGLMQLRPATARQVARRIHLPYSGTRTLINPRSNLRLGSAYLRQLQDRFSNHPLLAAAAYNAGPSPVLRWLPQTAAMDSDVWIENVPYTETREYLRRTLTYQLIYARRLRQGAVRMSAWMPRVPARPGGAR